MQMTRSTALEIVLNALALAALVALAALYLAVTPDGVNGDGETTESEVAR